MEIGVVIVSYNSATVLGACLASIPKGCEVIVVDNASHDASAAMAASMGARVIKNSRNIGFGAACNMGARALTSSHVLFLNPDAMLHDDALTHFKTAISHYPDAAAFGPKIVLPGGQESFRYSSYVSDQGGGYVSVKHAPVADCCVDFIDGSAMICNRTIFLSLDGFDENLFLYYEDDDLCFRMRRAGYSLVHVPSAIVGHEKKACTTPTLGLDYLRAWHETTSRVILSKKYGLPFNSKLFRRVCLIRITRALMTLSFKKAIRYLAMFSAAGSSNGYSRLDRAIMGFQGDR
jgi:N-acetylglucosaminyl-diphospho-decaprenol L-rhamnosyltransferase